MDIKDEKGTTIGRIGAFYDTQRSAVYRQKTGGIGFFEVINSKEAAFTFFDAARQWLASKGMQAMDGPINFGRTTATGAFWSTDSCSRVMACIQYEVLP